jgi:hypothetical protein
MKIFLFVICVALSSISVFAQVPDSLNKVQEFTKKNPECTNKVVESLKKDSTKACAMAVKEKSANKKQALQDKCTKLQSDLAQAQASCVKK